MVEACGFLYDLELAADLALADLTLDNSAGVTDAYR
jgi:hypothetical protein